MDRDRWLREGLNTLYESGIGRVKIEGLARRLRVTKGSFYWHFKKREDLLRAMIDFWKDAQLGLIKEMENSRITDPKLRLEELMAFIHSKDSSHDIGVRAWARTNPHAATAVRDVDRKRMAYVESVFSKLGFDAFESQLRARTLYFYQVGEHTSSIRDSAKLRDKLARSRFDWLVKKDR